MTTVKVGNEEIRLEQFSGRKAIRVIRTVEHITKGVPKILERWAEFTREYEASNVTEMDRTTARRYYGPAVLMDEEPVLAADGVTAIVNDMGDPIVRRSPRLGSDNKPVMGPDPLAHMTDADWEASGNKLRLPKTPSTEEKIAAIFPLALDLAEEETLRLLALLSMTNKQVKDAMKSDLPAALDERADELLDAPATDLLELAVASGEMVEEQFTSKVRELGDRLPNALRLFGVSPKSPKTTEPSKSKSSATKSDSSTDSPSPTDGTSEPSSTEPVGASSTTSAPD